MRPPLIQALRTGVRSEAAGLNGTVRPLPDRVIAPHLLRAVASSTPLLSCTDPHRITLHVGCPRQKRRCRRGRHCPASSRSRCRRRRSPHRSRCHRRPETDEFAESRRALPGNWWRSCLYGVEPDVGSLSTTVGSAGSRPPPLRPAVKARRGYDVVKRPRHDDSKRPRASMARSLP